MKRKIFSVLLVLALVLGLGLVTAVPAAAATTYNVAQYTLDNTGADTAAWSIEQHNTGTHSVKLIHTTGADIRAFVQFTPPTGIALTEFVAAPATYGFSYWRTEDKIGPQLELTFTDGANGWVELTAEVALYDYVTDDLQDQWIAKVLSGTEQCQFFGDDSADAAFTSTGLGDLSDLITDIAAVATADDAAAVGAWEMTKVIVDLGWSGDTQTAYVDDIIIDGTTYYGLFEDVIDVAAATGDTISVAAGTYSAETTWPIDVDKALTIQGAGVTSIIDPGENGLGVFEISVDNVTIDGFKIIQGTETVTFANPQEHLIWVHAEYSTISDNTILNKGGGTAGIFIGGRTADTPTGENTEDSVDTGKWGYQVSTPLGHTIQDNIFLNANAGEGWGIYAYDLTDSLIQGNSFVTEESNVPTDPWAWEGKEGAHGTGIIIVNATAGTAIGSPGGGYVVIEDNTAQYIKYSWLTFSSSYPFNESATDIDPGKMIEQSMDSTVNKVIVRNNTVSEIVQKPGGDSWSTAVKFVGSDQGNGYGVDGAYLTIGLDGVTITGNSFYDSDIGIEVSESGSYDAHAGYDAGYAAVLGADNISINYNLIYGNELFGLDNGARNNTVVNVGQAAKTVDAESNWWNDIYGPIHAGNPYTSSTSGDEVSSYVDYSPWMIHTELASGWNIYSPPWAPDTSTDTPDEALDIIGTDSGNVETVYYFNSSASTPAWAIATSLTPLEAIYLEMSAASTIDVAFSPSYTAPPSRTMYQGWNLFGPAAFANMDVDDALGDAYWGTGEASLVGYGHVESLAINQTATWTWLRGATMYPGSGSVVIPTEGYWVYMVNQGTLGGFTYTPIAIDMTTADPS